MTTLATQAIELLRTGEVRQPVTETIGARLVEPEPGRAVYEMPVAEALANPMGAVQGGIVTAMADAAVAVAAVGVLSDDEFSTTSVTTCDIFARFLAPVRVGRAQVLRGEATVVRHGRSLVWTECEVTADGAPVARFTGTGVKVSFSAGQYTETIGKPSTRIGAGA